MLFWDIAVLLRLRATYNSLETKHKISDVLSNIIDDNNNQILDTKVTLDVMDVNNNKPIRAIGTTKVPTQLYNIDFLDIDNQAGFVSRLS